MWSLSKNNAWVLDANGEVYLGPFSTRKVAGKLLAQEVLDALNAAYQAGQDSK